MRRMVEGPALTFKGLRLFPSLITVRRAGPSTAFGGPPPLRGFAAGEELGTERVTRRKSG